MTKIELDGCPEDILITLNNLRDFEIDSSGDKVTLTFDKKRAEAISDCREKEGTVTSNEEEGA